VSDSWAYLFAAEAMLAIQLSRIIFWLILGYRGGGSSPTAVQAWRPCPLLELSPTYTVFRKKKHPLSFCHIYE